MRNAGVRCRHCGYQVVVAVRPTACPACGQGAWESFAARTLHETPASAATSRGGAPSWQAVEDLLERLAATRENFPTATSTVNWVCEYEPGRRLLLVTESSSDWIQIDSVSGCWRTFERLGRVRRQDLLEPGRRSAFMMGLFQQVAGVCEGTGDEPCLVMPSA